MLFVFKQQKKSDKEQMLQSNYLGKDQTQIF